MNRAALINTMAEKTGLKKQDIDKVLDAFTETVTESLCKDEKVLLIGFGAFEPRKRAARTAKGLNGIGPVEIPECTSVAFKPGKLLKKALNGKEDEE